MKGLGVTVLLFLLTLWALPVSGQGVQFGGRFLSADFGNDFQFSPADPDITFPAGFGAFVLWPYSDHFLLGFDAKVAKVQNVEAELLSPMNGKVVFNAGALARIQRVPRGYFFKPYVQAGLGIMHINENTEWRPAVNVGVGLDLELNHGLALSFGAGYNRELARNRYYIDYGIGLTVAVNKDRSPSSYAQKATENDTDGDGILNESDACPEAPGGLATLGCPDQDEDGIPDKDDACPDQPGLIGNGGCPVVDDRVMDEGIDLWEEGLPDTTDIPGIEDPVVMDEGVDFEVKDELKDTVRMDSLPQLDDRVMDEGIDFRRAEIGDTSDIPETEDPVVMDEGIDLRNPSEKRDSVAMPSDKTEKDEQIAEEVTESRVYEKGDTVILEILPSAPDTDGDGIPDRIDECPEVFGNAKLMGCPEPDSDNDGVSDERDKCPEVPGSVYNQGCPEGYLIQIDSSFGEDDTERVEDSVVVMVPDHAPEVWDTLQVKGDTSVLAPTQDQTEGEVSKKEEESQFIDSDGDGIADRIDPCPFEAGTLDSKGCPESTDEGPEKEDDLGALSKESDFEFSPVINFETGTATLGRKYLPVLDDVVSFMKDHPEYRLGIYGHTDATGSNFVNDILSKRRAQACWTYLRYKGIPDSRMSYHGEGEYAPVSDNSTAEGRFKNRRVVFKFSK